MQSLKQQFTDWVASKPRDEEYRYGHCLNCAFARFLIASGICAEPNVGDKDWSDLAEVRRGGEFARRPLPRGLNDALVLHPWTFGALHDRLTA